MNGKSYILDPLYREIVEFVLSEINNQSYFRVNTIAKWYMFNELHLPRYKICGALLYSISNKISRIVKELVNLKVVIKDGKTRYRNLNRGNIKKVLEEQISKNDFIIKLKE